MQRRVVDASIRKVVLVQRKPGAGKVRGNLSRIRRDADRRGKGDLLPAGGGFSGKRGLRQQCTGAVIQQANVCSGVASSLVETNSGDRAADIGAKLYAQRNRIRIVIPGI